MAEDEAPFHGALKAYEYAKEEQLVSEGPEPLRRELAKLTNFLEGDRGPYMENVDVDVAFREAKARVLRRLLEQAQEDQ